MSPQYQMFQKTAKPTRKIHLVHNYWRHIRFVALDLSALVRYITRFTEECFACLIALIFIYQAFVILETRRVQ
jgi:hypothetical protein